MDGLQEPYITGARIPIHMQCGHLICLECITRLQSYHCPVCRKLISRITRTYIATQMQSL